jgi:hypothetical protein
MQFHEFIEKLKKQDISKLTLACIFDENAFDYIQVHTNDDPDDIMGHIEYGFTEIFEEDIPGINDIVIQLIGQFFAENGEYVIDPNEGTITKIADIYVPQQDYETDPLSFPIKYKPSESSLPIYLGREDEDYAPYSILVPIEIDDFDYKNSHCWW